MAGGIQEGCRLCLLHSRSSSASGLPPAEDRGARHLPGAGQFWVGVGIGILVGVVWAFDADPVNVAVMTNRAGLDIASGAMLGVILVIARWSPGRRRR